MRQIVVTVVLLINVVGCASPPQQAHPTPSAQRALAPSSGGGAVPLSPEVIALWLSRGARVRDTPQPFVMVFYKGTAGWHERPWQTSDDYGTAPSFLSMTSPALTLAVEESANGIVRIQGKVVDLAAANIFLVEQIDGASAAQVVPLGRLRVPIPAGVIPPRFVLSSQREIADRVE